MLADQLTGMGCGSEVKRKQDDRQQCHLRALRIREVEPTAFKRGSNMAAWALGHSLSVKSVRLGRVDGKVEPNEGLTILEKDR